MTTTQSRPAATVDHVQRGPNGRGARRRSSISAGTYCASSRSTAGPGEGDEREAAEYVAAKLEEVGLETTIVEFEQNRTSVVARMEGEDRCRGGLLIHGHLDVVPADAADANHWKGQSCQSRTIDLPGDQTVLCSAHD